MKRIAIASILALALAAGLSAQAAQPAAPAPGQAAAQPQAPATQTLVTVEGKLSFLNGAVAIQLKDKTYYVEMPRFAYGFIDGLKEGASVKLQGYEFVPPRALGYSILRVTKLSLNGKDYDFSQAVGSRAAMGGRGEGMMGGYGMMDGRGPGKGR